MRGGKARIARLQGGKESLELAFPKEMKTQVKKTSLKSALGIPEPCKPHPSPVLTRNNKRVSV